MKKSFLIIILFSIAIFLVYFFGGSSDYIKTGRLYISEIVASNKGIIKDEIGEFYDYIELYNGYGYDINLKNYRLTDNISDGKKWIFPDFVIKSGEYKVIFASGKNTCNQNACHVNFKLNIDGETLALLEPTGNIISRVTYPKLSKNVSYSLVKNKYVITNPTPNKENQYTKINFFERFKYHIVINEYVTHNQGSHYASNGGYFDWVELYNTSDNDINLKGLCLSDDPKFLNKFIMPDVVIKARDYLIVYLNGGEEIEGEIAANFKLSDNDEKIILSANEKIIDELKIVPLDKNMSYGKSGDGWLYFFTPTPGRENNTYGVSEWKVRENGNT